MMGVLGWQYNLGFGMAIRGFGEGYISYTFDAALME
jgi:hypothetical protein